MAILGPRDQILIHADKVFCAFGYRRASMGEVARVAGLSRQGLYHHFPDKPSLFGAVVEMIHADTVQQSMEARDAARGRGASLEEVMTTMLDARFGDLLRAHVSSPHRDELLDEVVKRCADIVGAHAVRFDQLLTDAIQDEIDLGHFRLADDMSAHDVAAALMALARGVNAALPPPDKQTVRGEYARHVRLVLRGANASR